MSALSEDQPAVLDRELEEEEEPRQPAHPVPHSAVGRTFE